MIDEQRTLEIFGYVSGDFGEQSHKIVVFVCEQCGRYRVGQKRDHRELCKGCTTGNRNTANTRPNIKKQCIECGKMFEVSPGREHQKYCSMECYDIHRVNNIVPRVKIVRPPKKVVEKIAKPYAGKIEVACEVCGKIFKRLANEENNKYCSYECRGIAWIGENNPCWKGGKIEKICEICGDVFEVYPNKETRKFCSHICHGISMRKEKNINWNGGTSFLPYCPKFDEAFKESIRIEFDRECFMCGMSEEENTIKLAVHHVSYDRDCMCNDIPCEFVPLCRSCHGKTNHDRDLWERLITNVLYYICSDEL